MKYAAIIVNPVFVPGDGKIYSDRYKDEISIWEFADEDEMKSWVADNTAQHSTPQKFKLIKYEELTYNTSVSVSIKEK